MPYSFLAGLPLRSVRCMRVAPSQGCVCPAHRCAQFLAECLAQSSTREILVRVRRGLRAGCSESSARCWDDAPEDAGQLRGEAGRLSDWELGPCSQSAWCESLTCLSH